MRSILAVAIALTMSASAAAQEGFTLDLEDLPLRPDDPRTEARLAQWNSPMGRVAAHVQQEQAQLGRSGLVGGWSPGVAVRVGFVTGLPPRVLTAVLDGGVQRYEQTVAVVRWPWSEADDGVEQVLPMDRQLGLLLGQRLEAAKDPTSERSRDER
jgi:hypothetical protein